MKVECQDCGHTWDFSGDDPSNARCSQAECGRSRDVEPVEEIDVDDEDTSEVAKSSSNIETSVADDELTDETSVAEDDDSSTGYSPAWQTTEEIADVEDDAPETPNDYAEDVEEYDQEDDEAAEGVESEEEPDVPEIEPEQIEPAIDGTFEIVANRRGEHWKLDEDETEQLANCWTPVLNHYAPAMAAEHMIVLIAASTTMAVVQPRIQKDKEIAEMERKTQLDDEPAEQRDTIDVEEDSQEEPNAEATAPGGWASV